jgi:hypothetical protein
MNDTEYAARALVDCVRRGDLDGLAMLCDLMGVEQLKPDSVTQEFLECRQLMLESVGRSFLVPAHLVSLRRPAP